jgi:anti-sigma factor RsiW
MSDDEERTRTMDGDEARARTMDGDEARARTMDGDEARARFDAALDDELSREERAEFDAALAADPALRAEYERLRSVLAGAGALGRVSSVDLLSGVQHKLRARSGGRFYRDRFAERRGGRGSLAWMLAISACLVLCVVLWFAYDAGLFLR